MKAEFRLQNVDAIEASLTITMPLGYWRKLHGILKNADHPGFLASMAIAEMVNKAEQTFSTTGEFERR